MRSNKRALIYSKFEINSILLYATMIAFMPIILVFTYIFDIDEHLDVNRFILLIEIINFVLMIVGSVALYLRKDHLKRQVSPTYRNEFIYLTALCAFGLLGFVVFYDYMGGDRAYIANILVFLFAILLYLLIFLGRKYFKFDYMRKK